MTDEEQARRQFLDEMEGLLGQPLPDDPQALAELESMLAGPDGEQISWTKALGQWKDVADEIAARPVDVADGFFVEEFFQAAVERIGETAFEPEALAGQPPGVRMLIATRAVEGEVDNGGWPAVFYNAMDGLLPLAIEGYELLGLADHATLAARILDHGFQDGAGDDADWTDFDEAWTTLRSPDAARAAYLRTHPAEFAAG